MSLCGALYILCRLLEGYFVERGDSKTSESGIICTDRVGLAAFWLLPVFSALLESKASAGSTFAWSWNSVNDLVAMPQKFILGSFGEKEWGDSKALPQLFIGGLGLFGVCTFFAKKRLHFVRN